MGTSSTSDESSSLYFSGELYSFCSIFFYFCVSFVSSRLVLFDYRSGIRSLTILLFSFSLNCSVITFFLPFYLTVVSFLGFFGSLLFSFLAVSAFVFFYDLVCLIGLKSSSGYDWAERIMSSLSKPSSSWSSGFFIWRYFWRCSVSNELSLLIFCWISPIVD